MIVAGAGFAGLSVARALTKLGVDVEVVAPDGGASAKGAGIVTPQFTSLEPVARRSMRILASLMPVHRCGMAQISLSKGSGLRGSLPDAPFTRRFRDRIVAASFAPDAFWVEDPLRHLSRGLTIRRGRVDRADVYATGIALPGVRVVRTRAARYRLDGVPFMLHVVDWGLYLRPGVVAGDGTADQLEYIFGRRPRLLESWWGRVAMAPRPILRRAGRAWLFGGLGGDGLSLAPALGERLASLIAARRVL